MPQATRSRVEKKVRAAFDLSCVQSKRFIVTIRYKDEKLTVLVEVVPRRLRRGDLPAVLAGATSFIGEDVGV